MISGVALLRAATMSPLVHRSPVVFPTTRFGSILTHRPPTTNQLQTRVYSRFPRLIKKVTESKLSRSSIKAVASPAYASTAMPSFSKIGFVGWYLGMVNSYPVLTKSITTSLIYIAADLSSQSIAKTLSQSYDWVRTARMGAYGLLILGPTLHFWFNFMSHLFPKQDLISTFKKMFLGQSVYGPIMTVVFFSLNAHLQGENGREIIARLKRDLLPTLFSGVLYWPICDFFTFRFFPVHLQPLVTNSFSYAWTVYITYMAGLNKASSPVS